MSGSESESGARRGNRDAGQSARRDREPTKRRSLWQLGGALVLAGALVATGIILSSGESTHRLMAGAPVPGAASVNALFAGVPEQGINLGEPTAPVTLEEFADLQCPFCRAFQRNALPAVIQRYVRPGRVRVVFHGLAFLGPDSTRAGRLAAAAALQNRLWPFVELFYANQGEENTGYATDGFLREIAAGVGLDVRRAFIDRSGPMAAQLLSAADASANALGIQSTPTFLIGRTGAKLRALTLNDLSAAEITPLLDRALRGG